MSPVRDWAPSDEYGEDERVAEELERDHRYGEHHFGQEPEPEEPGDRCTNAEGHEWVYTGTQYGGDDERWGGEGRCYCCFCGADGDA